MTTRRWVLGAGLTIAGLSTACTAEDGNSEGDSGIGSIGAGMDTDATGGSSSTGADPDPSGADTTMGPGGSGDDTDGGGGPKFDVPNGGDVQIDDGCAAVDFLFVIDNSISMQDQQNALKAAFPEFIATIQTTLPTTDYHIMVVDTDADGRCSPGTCSHNTCQEAGQYACGPGFTDCDTTRGAGVVHPAGQGASNMECTLDGGNRYIVEGQPDLEGTFECVASVGLAGHPSERPIDGLVEAVSDPLQGPGGCNEGFLRDDGILVVTFISDDPNVEDQNSAQEAYDAVVAAKGGNAEAIVVLGLIPNNQPHWEDFIIRFGDRGLQGSVNEDDYNQFFLDAVSTIQDTCLDFEG